MNSTKFDNDKIYLFLLNLLKIENQSYKIIRFSLKWIEFLEKRSDCHVFNYSIKIISILMKLLKNDKEKEIVDECFNFINHTLKISIENLILSENDIVTIDMHKTLQ